MENQRSLLDKLMGSDRNMDDDQRKENRRNRVFKRWHDDGICPYYLCGLCPHDLFFNTKCDLGKCTLDHDDNAFYDFSRQSPKTKRPIQKEALDLYRGLMDQVGSWVRQARRKIQRQEDYNNNSEEEKWLEERRQFIKDEIVKQKDSIKTMEKEIKRLGETGQIKEAQDLLLEAETVKESLVKLKGSTVGSSFWMGACGVCGGKTSTLGQKQREDSHMTGRRHQGFLKIIQKIETMEHLNLGSPDRDSSASHSSRSRSYSRRTRTSEADRRKSSRSPDRASAGSKSGSHTSRSRSYSRRRWSSSSRSGSRSRSRSTSRRKRRRSSSYRDKSHESNRKAPKTDGNKADVLQVKENVEDPPQNNGLTVIVNPEVMLNSSDEDDSEDKCPELTISGINKPLNILPRPRVVPTGSTLV